MSDIVLGECDEVDDVGESRISGTEVERVGEVGPALVSDDAILCPLVGVEGRIGEDSLCLVADCLCEEGLDVLEVCTGDDQCNGVDTMLCNGGRTGDPGGGTCDGELDVQ